MTVRDYFTDAVYEKLLEKSKGMMFLHMGEHITMSECTKDDLLVMAAWMLDNDIEMRKSYEQHIDELYSCIRRSR